MKRILYTCQLVSIFLICGCGNSIEDAVKELPVTKKYDLIDVLKKSKLIDSYEMKVINDEPLRGEVALLIKLKNDAIMDEQNVLKNNKNAYFVIFAQFFLDQAISKDVWSMGHTAIRGQFSTGKNTLGDPFFLHPSIFVHLANNERINIDKLKTTQDLW